jgi:hypothetical protein
MVILESHHTINTICHPGTWPCIESAHVGLLIYHKYEVASPLTPSTGESLFSYDIAAHPNQSSKCGTS